MFQIPISQPGSTIRNSQDGQAAPVLFDRKQWLYIQGLYNLTPRELQIAELLCSGLSNEKIAKIIKIKAGTVKTHTRNIYRKVRVKNKMAMLLRFVGDTKK